VNDDAAAFCRACGASLAAPPSAAPPQVQPYAAPPAPAKKKKKILPIVLTVVCVIVVVTAAAAALYLFLPRPGADIADPPAPDAPEVVENVVAEEKKDIAEEKEEEEEEEVDDGPVDPPFITLLKSGEYCFDYEMHMPSSFDSDENYELFNSGYKAKTVGMECTYAVYKDGYGDRIVLDEAAKKRYIVNDSSKHCEEYNAPTLVLTDFAAFELTDTGTEMLIDEMLDYMEYKSTSDIDEMVHFFEIPESGLRVYLKDGDVYAYKHFLLGTLQNTIYYVSNASPNPSPECFEIPDTYSRSVITYSTDRE